MAIRQRSTRGVKVGGRAARSLGNQLAANKKKKEGGAFSVFSAADNIKYRKYQNRMAMEGGKSQPLSKEQWSKTGKPK